MIKSLWNDQEAAELGNDPLKLRVYSSRLLGREADLVLHGGGNTSVKATSTDWLGDTEEVLYVKGSGWDLATIEAPGFAPVKLDTLRRLARLEALSDTDMVAMQRAAMTDPAAPDPSVEAILHAIIPFKYVDHTHADAVVTLTNTQGGEDKIRELYGDRVIVIPYVMPGFMLARTVADLTHDLDWGRVEGMILLNHGIFTFHDDARESYQRMIRLVHEAEEYLHARRAMTLATAAAEEVNHTALARIRRQVSLKAGRPLIARLDNSPEARGFADLPRVATIATRGPITPDHVIRTKRIPLLMDQAGNADLEAYEQAYRQYFEANQNTGLTCLDPAPRWAVWPGQGVIGFGTDGQNARIVADINAHTLRCIQYGEGLGGWQALPADKIFEVEYWELEQAKLKKTGNTGAPLTGQIALVTGAANGIGRACVNTLLAQGACVAGLDINPDIATAFPEKTAAIGLTYDVTDPAALQTAIAETIRTYGGLDILVSNVGLFPASRSIEDMDPELWRQCLDMNLTSAMTLVKYSIPYLRHGWEPAIVFIGSRNVPAPGPGAAAYSASKAGLNQLARVAALELAPDGVRVNSIHPDAVFDTALWTPEVIAARAASYGLSVADYKRRNLLKTEISSKNVAEMACAMAGSIFAKTTGAQVAIDGGNDRVI